jgi:hypothetical protein
MLNSPEMQVEQPLSGERVEALYLRVLSELKPRSAPPRIEVEFCQFANANSFIKMSEGLVHVRLTDLLAGAPPSVMEALAWILLSKLFRKPVPRIHEHRYRVFMNRGEMRRTMHSVRQERGRKFVSGPQGRHYNLEQVFEDINFRFFHGLMARPQLGWSRKTSRSTLGHYDPSHHAIIISRILDSPKVPPLALEYVVFHEMLHLRHPVDHSGARRRVHTREFRDAEKQFPRFQEAVELLKRL